MAEHLDAILIGFALVMGLFRVSIAIERSGDHAGKGGCGRG